MGKVDYQGVQRETSFMMLPEAKVGDYVILHAGFAIKRLSEEDALETLELIREMLKAGEERELKPTTETTEDTERKSNEIRRGNS